MSDADTPTLQAADNLIVACLYCTVIWHSLIFLTCIGGGTAVPPSLPPIDNTAESTVAVHDGAEKPALTSIWEDDYCEPNGDDSWWCLQYNITFKPKHATWAAAHFAKKKRIGIKACPAIVPDADLKRYCDFLDSIVGKANKCKHGVDALMALATQCQDAAAFSLIEKKLKHPFCLFY